MQMKCARIGEQLSERARCGAKHAIQLRTAKIDYNITNVNVFAPRAYSFTSYKSLFTPIHGQHVIRLLHSGVVFIYFYYVAIREHEACKTNANRTKLTDVVCTVLLCDLRRRLLR